MPRKTKAVYASDSASRPSPALNPEDRENQMIALAVDLAEKQLREGTASAQVITHYLKLATTRERIEQEILKRQEELIEAKTEAYRSSSRAEVEYQQVIEALKRYGGLNEPSQDKNVFRDD
jgi:hypothetical protein